MSRNLHIVKSPPPPHHILGGLAKLELQVVTATPISVEEAMESVQIITRT